VLGTFVSVNAGAVLDGVELVVAPGVLTIVAAGSASAALNGCSVSAQSGRIIVRDFSSKTRSLLFVNIYEEDLVA
jgi:hypothetical protein